MNTYELIYIVPSTLSETQLAHIQKQVEDILQKEKAEVVHHKVWRRSNLAYQIGQVEHAYYVLVYLRAEAEKLPGIQRGLLLFKEIVRYRIFVCEDIDKQKKYFIDGYKEPETKQLVVTQDQEKKPVKRTPVVPKLVQKTPEDYKKEVPKKQKTTPSLEDLDKKLDDILKGEIEL